MLTRTYIHAPGVGAATERKLWTSGYNSWQACLNDHHRLPVGESIKPALIRTLYDSVDALQAGNSRYFARELPPAEHWRAAKAFNRVGYLDIETDGGETVTVVGLYDGTKVHQFLRNENLQDFPDAVEEYDLLVTFFGAGFDIPMLKRSFRWIKLDMLHLDLCFALRKLGYKGGLKSIERIFGIERSPRTTGLDGWDAVRLWREYRLGSHSSLATLLAYNAEDVVNLAPLLDVAYEGLQRATMER